MTARAIAAAVTGAAVLPGLARACPVCFGQDLDNPGLGSAFNAGLFLLMGVTFALLLAGVAWFYRIERRRRLLDLRYLDLIATAGAAEADRTAS